MTDESKVPDPPSVVMDRFIYAVPTLVKTEESLDRLSQVIVTVFDTLFIAPLSQPLNPESAILFGKSRAALACMRTLFHAKEGLVSFTSASETARHKGIPLYKTLLPRFIHAAALAAERDDTASMVEDLVETVSDVLAVLERRSEPGQPYTEGWSLAHRAVKAIKTFVQGELIDYSCGSGADGPRLVTTTSRCTVWLRRPDPVPDSRRYLRADHCTSSTLLP